MMLAFLMSESVTPLREPLEEKTFLCLLVVVTLLCWALVRWKKGLAAFGLLIAGCSGYRVLATVRGSWLDGCPWLHSKFDVLYAVLAFLTFVLPFVMIAAALRGGKGKKGHPPPYNPIH